MLTSDLLVKYELNCYISKPVVHFAIQGLSD